MASLGMEKAYHLLAHVIDREVTRTSPGNYALGETNNGVFRVMYVGRSDTCVKTRLKQHVGTYSSFKFAYATSPKAAFEKECQNFHDFGEVTKLANEIHPDRPAGSDWKCPVCDCFG